MSRMLWGPSGGYWEAVYHQAYHVWEFLDPDDCPFSLHYAKFSSIVPEACTICGQTAEPAVRLKDPVTKTPLRFFGPFCLACVTSNPNWLKKSGLPIPECLSKEEQP